MGVSAVVGPLAIFHPQARYSAVVCLWVHLMPWKRKKCWTADALCRLEPSVTPQYDSELYLGSPEASIPREEESSEGEIPVTGDYLRAQLVQRGLSQTAKPARESLVQIRLASHATDCGDRVHDLPGSRARCLSSVQCVRTSQSSGAVLGASVPAGPSASRRIQLAVRPSALVWELGQSRQPLFRAHTQCVRRRTAAPRPDVSLCVSRVRAPAASACEFCDSGAPGKESTWRRAKHPKSD